MKNFQRKLKKHPIFAPELKSGHMAERLGSALQKLLRRFESVCDLSLQASTQSSGGFFYW